MRRLLAYTKDYTGMQIVGAIFTILYTAAVICGPLVSRYLIDTVIPSESTEGLVRGLLIFAGVMLAQPAVGIIKDRIFLRITEGMTRDIRNSLFHRVLWAPLPFFDKSSRGAVISRILNDSREAGQFVSNFFVVFLKNILLLLLVTGAMFVLSPVITGVIFLSLLLYLYANWRFSMRLSDMQQQVTQNYDDMTTRIEQMNSNIFTIKSQQMETVVAKDYDALLEKSYGDNRRIGSLEILMENFTTVLAVVALVAVYGLGASEVMQGRMTLGTVIALGLYFQQLIQPIFELMHSGIGFRKMVPILARIGEYESISQESFDQKQGIHAVFSEEIEIKNLKYHYPGRAPLFDGLDMSFAGKKTTCLIGGSGSGKSTLAYLLMGFYRPVQGEIRIGGVSIEEIGMYALRENIGYVSQHIELMNWSIRENLCRGEMEEERMVQACRELGLHEKIMRLPDGYDTVVTERMNLSGGERQRLAIVRALMRNPKILILDEPTSALDAANEAAVLEVLRKLRGRYTIIVITHRPNLIAVSDAVVEMEPTPARKQA